MSVIAGYHLSRAVEGLFQTIADLAKRRHFAPTRAHCAGTGQSVAFALSPHEISYGLKSEL